MNTDRRVFNNEYEYVIRRSGIKRQNHIDF